MKNNFISRFLTVGSFLLILSACSQGNQSTEVFEEKSKDKIEINLDNYIPEKPELSQISSLSDRPHDGTLRSTPKPSFPARAEKSGHCIYIISVTTLGMVDTIERLDCSDDVFTKHTKQKSLQWVFHPKKDDSENNIAFKVGPQKITYRFTDEDGNLIPE